MAAGAPEGSALRAVEIDPRTDERWDRYVTAHPDGLVYHHSAYLRVLEREYGQRARALAVEDSERRLRAVLPLMLTRGVPGARGGLAAGRRLASLPRTPLAGPLGDDRAALAAVVRAAIERTPPGARLQLKPAEPTLDGLVEGLAGAPYATTYVVELPARAEDLRFGDSRNHNRIRTGVRKALREGLAVRSAEQGSDLREWYRLYLDTMRHRLVPARPRRLFDAMWEELRPRGMMDLLLVEHRGTMLAGSILLGTGPTQFYAFNGVRRSTLALRPNDLLQWHALERACHDGRRRYDLGEVADGNEGLAAFKRKWGAEAQRLWRYYHPPPPADDAHEEEGGARGRELATRVWRRVPLTATAATGRVIYRYL